MLVALENLSGLGWMDLTFGQLDGWWRFADDYRPHHALASPAVWRQALGDAGFTGAEVLGVDESDASVTPDKGVIVAQGPRDVKEPRGLWILTGDQDGLGTGLAADLAARNQTVVLANGAAPGEDAPAPQGPGVFGAAVEPERRESWGSLIESLPEDTPFSGVVHLGSLDGHGPSATTAEIAEDVRRGTASALALTQAVADADLTPAKGMWFLTRGAQVLERENAGELAGATLWGFGKAVVREAPHLQARMLDLDPAPLAPEPDLPNELLYPDAENHIAYRRGARRVARLVRAGDEVERLALPDDPEWALAPDPEGVFDKPCVKPLPARPLEPREVRVGVEAAGLNFWDVFRSLGFIPEGNLGREMCGRILEVGSEVSRVSVGDPIVGLGFGAFAAAMVTHEELVAPAPPGFSVTGLATVPSAFVSAALSFEFTGLAAGERVLVHAGAGGVGLAAIQWVQGRRRGGLRHRQRTEAGIPPLAGRRARLRQPPDGVRGGDPRSHRRRGRGRRPQQPHRRGLYRGQPLLPPAGRPLRGNGPAGHPQRGGDGGGASRRPLPHPRTGRAQEDRAGEGGEGLPRRHGAGGGRESCNPSSTAGGRWRRRAPRSASCGPRATSGRSW